ncbi:MAG: hypothetical protein WAW36_07810 [Methylovulum miyakonense]
MKKTNNMTDRKRGLGRGLEVLLADTQPLDATQSSSAKPAAAASTQEVAQTASGTLHDERLQLLKEAEALRILMLEFELIMRADLH